MIRESKVKTNLPLSSYLSYDDFKSNQLLPDHSGTLPRFYTGEHNDKLFLKTDGR